MTSQKSSDELADAHVEFSKLLRRRLRVWRVGRLVSSLLKVLRSGALLFLALAVIDVFIAFSPQARMGLSAAILFWLSFLFLWELIFGLALSRKEMAVRADQLLRQARQPVLTAYELGALSQSDFGELG